jgi:hypothetical protein
VQSSLRIEEWQGHANPTCSEQFDNFPDFFSTAAGLTASALLM